MSASRVYRQQDGGAVVHDYLWTQFLFTKLVFAIYLIAFGSLLPQLKGLYGSRGILPLAQLLDGIQRSQRRFYPSLFWISASDHALVGVGAAGVLGAGIGLIGIIPDAATLLVLYILFLSLCSIGQEFLQFQWDALLLETGFYALLLNLCGPPPLLGIWLLWLLLFRLVFSSGLVKLRSGCPKWSSWTALNYHYWSQPLPNPLAWYLHHMSPLFHTISTGVVYFLELMAPFGIWTPLPFRYTAFMLMVLLQVLIMITGNYAYFNLLTIVLCVPLLPLGSFEIVETSLYVTVIVNAVCGLFIVLNIAKLVPRLQSIPLIRPALHYASRFHLVNGYGLFAVMTTDREEIIVEGSRDGQNWRAYEFRFKPGDVQQPPPIVAPYHPRLDWQMWFAALRPYSHTPWFRLFLIRLLEGSPDVLCLLKTNPFPERPPKMVRARRCRYRFSDKESDLWWERTQVGVYAPPTQLS